MVRAKNRRSRQRVTADVADLSHVFGGRLRPLSDEALAAIVETAFGILSGIGMADVPDDLSDRLIASGAQETGQGRLLLPRPMVEDALARAPGSVQLPGFRARRDLTIGGQAVHLGAGGAAVQVLDGATNTYRASTLADLYDLMRVVDASATIHYGLRPSVACDLEDPFALDINTAFACMKATDKPVGVSFSAPENVGPVIDMFDAALGGPGAFRARPFAMAVIVHVVPPLRYASEGIAALRMAVEAGMIPQICSAGQAGATSPASLAGALAQGLAESLAGLVAVDAFCPGAPCIYAFMPFVSDLRTGAKTGGGGECAMANAAAAQLLAHLNLPSTVSAGMTDAKVMDAQAGYEKGHTIALAAQAGANMINLSMGMLGSIMVASPETMVIDADLCAPILRGVQGIDVAEGALDLTMIEEVVAGDGHYLGANDTLRRMTSDYVYPDLANRQSVSEWLEAGSPSIWDAAHDRVAAILNAPDPVHLDPAVEAKLRAKFPIRLP